MRARYIGCATPTVTESIGIRGAPVVSGALGFDAYPVDTNVTKAESIAKALLPTAAVLSALLKEACASFVVNTGRTTGAVDAEIAVFAIVIVSASPAHRAPALVADAGTALPIDKAGLPSATPVEAAPAIGIALHAALVVERASQCCDLAAGGRCAASFHALQPKCAGGVEAGLPLESVRPTSTTNDDYPHREKPNLAHRQSSLSLRSGTTAVAHRRQRLASVFGRCLTVE
ncbi:MAG: hypothetical protein ACO3JL_08460 [Myxococcota bacterium]